MIILNSIWLVNVSITTTLEYMVDTTETSRARIVTIVVADLGRIWGIKHKMSRDNLTIGKLLTIPIAKIMWNVKSIIATSPIRT